MATRSVRAFATTFAVLALADLTLAGCGDDSSGNGPRTREVNVTRSGTGTGTVTSTPTGINCGATCTLTLLATTPVTLTAAAAANSRFVGWTGACTGTVPDCALTAGRDALDAAVTAQFDLIVHALTIVRAGTGTGNVSSNPDGIICGTVCTAGFAVGSMVTLTTQLGVGSTFAGWSGGGCTGTGACVVTMSAATSVTATFNLSTNSLTVTPAGNGAGTVTSSPAGITCGSDCTEPYAFGTAVTLTAAAATGSTFTGWSGGGCTGTGTCVVTINQATNVTATFTLVTNTLTVTRAGTGSGSVISAPAGITCGTDCSESYAFGTVVTLAATALETSVFTGWSGGGCTGTGACVVTMNAAATVTATFSLLAPVFGKDSPTKPPHD